MLLVLLLHTIQAQIAPPLALDVMSFNVRFGTAADGENSWKYRKDLVVETIEQYDPDLVGLQECLAFQADYITDNLSEYASFGIGRDRNGQGEQTAVLYKKRDYIPVETGHFWLSDEPDVPGSVGWDAALTRMATWVKFHHHPSGRFIFFANTHFDHKGEFARTASAELLGERLHELAGDLPIVLTGDFNAAAGSSAPWEALINSGLEDAWLSAAEQLGPEYTFNGWRPLNPEGTGRIDWVMTSPGIRVDHCETVIKNADGRFPSDHFPIYARLQIDAPESTVEALSE